MAHYDSDNPAGRLYRLFMDLHAAFPTDQQQRPKQAWTAIVALVGNEAGLAGEAAIVSGVASLPAQIRDAVHALAVDDGRKEHLLDGLSEIERGIFQMLNRQSLYSVFCEFATSGVVPQSAAISGLSHCSYELHRSAPEVTVSDEDLERIISLITELMEDVSDADLPDMVKRVMLNHLSALLQAARNVRFAGTQPLDDALFALTGSVVNRANAEEDLSRVGLWEKFKKVVQGLNLMLSMAQGAAQLEQGISRILGQ